MNACTNGLPFLLSNAVEMAACKITSTKIQYDGRLARYVWKFSVFTLAQTNQTAARPETVDKSFYYYSVSLARPSRKHDGTLNK